MSYERVAYDDAATPAQMASDCKAVGIAMHLPRQVRRSAQSTFDAAPDAMVPQPPASARRAGIAVNDAAARFAGRFLD